MDLPADPKSKGSVKYGPDLSGKVPNDPKIKPRDSVRILETRKLNANERSIINRGGVVSRSFNQGLFEVRAEATKKRGSIYYKRRGLKNFGSRLVNLGRGRSRR